MYVSDLKRRGDLGVVKGFRYPRAVDLCYRDSGIVLHVAFWLRWGCGCRFDLI